MLPVPSKQKIEGASLCPVWLGYIQVALREEGTAGRGGARVLERWPECV